MNGGCFAPMRAGDRVAHDPGLRAATTLLGRAIPMVEHLRGLEQLPDRGSRSFAVSVKVKAFDTIPVRAFAIA